jgi:hypothetical protein
MKTLVNHFVTSMGTLTTLYLPIILGLFRILQLDSMSLLILACKKKKKKKKKKERKKERKKGSSRICIFIKASFTWLSLFLWTGHILAGYPPFICIT